MGRHNTTTPDNEKDVETSESIDDNHSNVNCVNLAVDQLQTFQSGLGNEFMTTGSVANSILLSTLQNSHSCVQTSAQGVFLPTQEPSFVQWEFRENIQCVPHIVVESCIVSQPAVTGSDTGDMSCNRSSLAIPVVTKKMRTSSDSILYAVEKETKRQALSQDHQHLLHHTSSASTLLLTENHISVSSTRAGSPLSYLVNLNDGTSFQSGEMAGGTDCIPTSLKHKTFVKMETTSEFVAAESNVIDLSREKCETDVTDPVRLVDHQQDSENREDSMLLTKRLKLKRYLQDRYQLGLQSTVIESKSVALAGAEASSVNRQEIIVDDIKYDNAQWIEYRPLQVSRVKEIPPLVIKSDTGSEPATPSVFPSPTQSTTSYSPVFGSPHSSVDSPQYGASQQGSFFRFYVPTRIPISSSEWPQEGEQPSKIGRYPTVSEYPLNPRLAAQHKLEGIERANTFSFSPSAISSTKRHLWRPMSASSHQSEPIPSPLTAKSRFLFQPEVFAHHLRLTESPPRSPFGVSCSSPGWAAQRHSTFIGGQLPSAGIAIPTRSPQQAPIAASYPPPRHGVKVPLSPREAMTSFTCPVCHEVLPTYGALADHMVTHVASEMKIGAEGTKVYVCKGCKRTFSRSDMLTRHMRLHTGLKPYECVICGQVFSRSDHLHTHLRTHTGEKPYHCTLCSYAAPRRDMITRHMRVHGKRATGCNRGRSLSSSSCSDIAVSHSDVNDLRKYSLSSGESPESSDQSVRGSATESPTGRNQFWYGGPSFESMDSEPNDYVRESSLILSPAGKMPLQEWSLTSTQTKMSNLSEKSDVCDSESRQIFNTRGNVMETNQAQNSLG